MVGKYAVNWYLKDKILPYTGHIEDFDLSIFRGAYQFEGFVIEKYREDQKKKLRLEFPLKDPSRNFRFQEKKPSFRP